MKAKFLFLGTGGSMGVPMIGCHCPVCTSQNPKNKRLRPSALIEIGGKRLLLDAGPDFRQQALRVGLDKLDGVLFTHSHFDHIAGIDELKVYSFGKEAKLPALVSIATFDELKLRYHYLMDGGEANSSVCRDLHFSLLEGDFGEISFLGVKVGYVTYEQKGMKVNGFVMGSLAYLTDIKVYTQEVIERVRGVETLVIGALREEDSPGHLSFAQAVDFGAEVGAKRVIFTHIGHEVEHESSSKKLPEGVFIGYDGMELVLFPR